MCNYVEGGLAEFASPPYVFQNLTCATFTLKTKGDRPYLQDICDKFLNGPLGRVESDELFEPANDKVIVTCSTFPRSAAGPPVVFGYSKYTEIAFMFSVYDRKNDEWSWYVPGLYLDGPTTGDEEWQAALPISIGRELFGLSKRRAEIELDTTYHTGRLKTLTAPPPGQPIDVAEVLEISLSLAYEQNLLTSNLTDAELELIEACRESEPEDRHRFRGDDKTEKLRAERDDVRRRLHDAKRKLERVREPEPLTPKELMVRLWSENPYAEVTPRAGVEPPTGEELLKKLGFVQSEWPSESATVLYSSMSPYAYEFDFRLLGLRQFRNPEQPQTAAYQRIVRTQLLFDRLPWGPLLHYYVEIEPTSDIAKLLGLQTQNLNPDQIYVNKTANAMFGDKVFVY